MLPSLLHSQDIQVGVDANLYSMSVCLVFLRIPEVECGGHDVISLAVVLHRGTI